MSPIRTAPEWRQLLLRVRPSVSSVIYGVSGSALTRSYSSDKHRHSEPSPRAPPRRSSEVQTRQVLSSVVAVGMMPVYARAGTESPRSRHSSFADPVVVMLTVLLKSHEFPVGGLSYVRLRCHDWKRHGGSAVGDPRPSHLELRSRDLPCRATGAQLFVVLSR